VAVVGDGVVGGASGRLRNAKVRVVGKNKEPGALWHGSENARVQLKHLLRDQRHIPVAVTWWSCVGERAIFQIVSCHCIV